MWGLTPGDEARIRNRYRDLLRDVSIEASLGPLGAAQRAGVVSGYLSSNVVLDAGSPVPSLRGQRELTPFLQQAFLRLNALEVKNQGFRLEEDPERGGYTLTGSLWVRAAGQGHADEWLAEYRFQWVKEDDWVIGVVERHHTIRPPGGP